MRLSLLNLISTPAAVLHSAGLELALGLSSDDPMVGRRPSEPYDAYLSVYAPDGRFEQRLALGRIAPHRRELFEVSQIVERFGYADDHLVVAHRIPASLMERYGPVVDEPVDLPDTLDYGFFRSYVQYRYPDGGGAHGSVIYEIPHRFNETPAGKPQPVVLTFTTKIVLSDTVETRVVLLNCSTNPRYATTAHYRYAVHAGDGSPVAVGQCGVPPFAVRTMPIRQAVSAQAVAAARDPADGLSHFCFYGICENASVAVLILNLAPALRGVSIEHTHPTQTYLMPTVPHDAQSLKRSAVSGWRTLLDQAEAHVAEVSQGVGG